jgi:hypothetical protein
MEVAMYKFSWERIKEARKRRLDRLSYGSDEEYCAHLLNEFASMCTYNYSSLVAKHIVPATLPDTDWHELDTRSGHDS